MLTYGVAGVCGTQYASKIEPKWLSVERVSVPLQRLKSALKDLKIVQLSDIHLHPHTQIELVEKAESIFDLAPALAGLNARYGIYSILGNTICGRMQESFEGD